MREVPCEEAQLCRSIAADVVVRNIASMSGKQRLEGDG